ncbi:MULTISPECIES: hypothetical protein [unclassified Dehalobacter]|uniref:hypothetical protein n=1 Tax=unclassified Dehalobacter TaxID=2635733 RepID=UPI0010534CB7|nr:MULTISPECIES: hypothetical protein [unclassified Dehalobacter]TCX50969.1 hypothetical protein C1I36_07170 [Dehalobacter sp. 14DCB1]TCX54614.1 hypothetical protein C1I38_05355 [Dehalobacter sp. 12DCB1]
MKQEIEHKLEILIGLPFLRCGRACDLQWFGFGKDVQRVDHNGSIRNVHEYAVHIQCAWRITGPKGIIVASRDRYMPKDGWQGDEQDFEWDVQGENRCDQQISQFFREYNNLIVKSVVADRFGGFCIALSDGFNIEAFPDDSDDGEHWRYFTFIDDSPHFIVSGQGISCD